MRTNEYEATWKKVENDKIRAKIRALESEKQSAIVDAQARFEQRKDSVNSMYDDRIYTLDTAKSKLIYTIDSTNKTELVKSEERVESNRKYAGGLTLLTQLILAFCRVCAGLMYRKAGEEYVAIGKFMSWFNPFQNIIDDIEFQISVWMRKRQIANAEKKGVRLHEVINLTDQAMTNETTAIFLNNEVKNVRGAALMLRAGTIQGASKTPASMIEPTDNLEEKISEKMPVFVAQSDEKAIILQEIRDIIQGYEIALETADEEESEEINTIIQGYKIILYEQE